jgi:NADH dehydrogenase (ubiquinone) 1 alpha subcomplex subunit 5
LYTVKRLPEDAIYRKSVESTTRFRLSVAEKETSIPKLEESINGGQVEELIQQAKDELSLVIKMDEWKVGDS